MMKRWALDALGWFVDWEPGIPFDYDVRHCTYWMWRHRLAGWFVCPWKRHRWYPDMCMRPEHDLCYRCGERRDRT